MARKTVVFQVGNGCAVRLVGDCKLPRGMLVRAGESIALEPVLDAWPKAFLAAAGAWKGPLLRPGGGEVTRDPFA